MGSTQVRLQELKQELENTYLEMKVILRKNNTARRMVINLPPDEYVKWNDLKL